MCKLVEKCTSQAKKQKIKLVLPNSFYWFIFFKIDKTNLIQLYIAFNSHISGKHLPKIDQTRQVELHWVIALWPWKVIASREGIDWVMCKVIDFPKVLNLWTWKVIALKPGDGCILGWVNCWGVVDPWTWGVIILKLGNDWVHSDHLISWFI